MDTETRLFDIIGTGFQVEELAKKFGMTPVFVDTKWIEVAENDPRGTRDFDGSGPCMVYITFFEVTSTPARLDMLTTFIDAFNRHGG